MSFHYPGNKIPYSEMRVTQKGAESILFLDNFHITNADTDNVISI